MAILSKAQFSGTYLTSTGTFLDNATQEISPADLRAGFQDYYDSQISNWPLDQSGIIGSDSVSGLVGADFASGLPAPAWKESRVFYDNENKTFSTYCDISGVQLQIGQELYIRAVNKTGSTIPNGTVVAATGAQGNRLTVEPAIADKDYTNITDIIGVTTHAVDNNQEVLVTTDGAVAMDTTSLGDGSGLWLSTTTSGAFQLAQPTAPDPAIHLGTSLNTTVDGKIQVHIIPSRTLEDASNINGSTAKEGYILGYINDSGYWDATDRINTSGGFKFGDVDAGNYSAFEEDTGFLMADGSGVAWDDLRFPVVGVAFYSAAGRVDYNYDENTLDFQDNATSADKAHIVAQMQHSYKSNSSVHPHIHWIQNQSGYPDWHLRYRHYGNGDLVPTGWYDVSISASAHIYTYVSGNLLQISEFPVISGVDLSGYGVSWILDGQIYRNSAGDSYTGDASLKEFDLHYQIDTRGSRQEYIK
jgi:hypothetical protein